MNTYIKEKLKSKMPIIYKFYRKHYMNFGKSLVQLSKASREYNVKKLVEIIQKKAESLYE